MATLAQDHATTPPGVVTNGHHHGTHGTSDTSTPPNEEKLEEGTYGTHENLETIRTISRVPGNTHYYEKDGLRTYGDDEDHDHEPPVSTSPKLCPDPSNL
jgi:hypothetical protein